MSVDSIHPGRVDRDLIAEAEEFGNAWAFWAQHLAHLGMQATTGDPSLEVVKDLADAAASFTSWHRSYLDEVDETIAEHKARIAELSDELRELRGTA